MSDLIRLFFQEQSNLDLHCWLRLFCPNTRKLYGKLSLTSRKVPGCQGIGLSGIAPNMWCKTFNLIFIGLLRKRQVKLIMSNANDY